MFVAASIGRSVLGSGERESISLEQFTNRLGIASEDVVLLSEETPDVSFIAQDADDGARIGQDERRTAPSPARILNGSQLDCMSALAVGPDNGFFL